jgi:hypothetical protein
MKVDKTSILRDQMCGLSVRHLLRAAPVARAFLSGTAL